MTHSPSPAPSHIGVRQSNFELLRILAMIMIIFHHFSLHGGFNFSSTTLSIPRFWYQFIIMGGRIGVNLYVLISGYFLIESKAENVSIYKVLKLWGQVVFYSAAIYALRLILGEALSVKQLYAVLRPIMKGAWWFASAYFVLYLLHPYLNRILRSLDKTVYQRLLMLMLFMWCVIPTVFMAWFESNDLVWFVTLYAIAGYIRLYGLNPFIERNAGKLAAVFAVMVYCLNFLLTVMGTRKEFFSNISTFYYNSQSVFALAVSVCLLISFSKISIPYSKWINTIASATFGVYLLHDHDFTRPLLWNQVFHNASYQNSLMLIPYSIAVVCLVFIVCTLIDLLRQKLIEPLFLKLVKHCSGAMEAAIGKICGTLCKLFFADNSHT